MRVLIPIVIFAVRIAPLSAATPITYERLMRAMGAADTGDSSIAASLGIDLKAYNFTWDFRVGRELKLLYLFRETKAGKTRRLTEPYQCTKGRFVATR